MSGVDPVLEPLLPRLAAFRRRLHEHAEVAGEESRTASLVEEFVSGFAPADTRTGLGGHGLAFVFRGAAPGPTVLFRAELDALPIPEANDVEYRSLSPGASHKCGHDGHMAILAGLAGVLAGRPPACGAAVLLFQPAEETGQGAARVLEDPAFRALAPERVFALHNLPGFPAGAAVVREGPITCASRGLVVDLAGRTAHAAHPENGVSPAPALCRIVDALAALPGRPEFADRFAAVTVVHARLGEPAFGTAPGRAAVMATLRTESDADMEDLARAAVRTAVEEGERDGLGVETGWRDVFAAGSNHAAAVSAVRAAAARAGAPLITLEAPIRESEDFGRFTARYPGALFGLGAGEDATPLHRPEYDFPEDLIRAGVRILAELAAAETAGEG